MKITFDLTTSEAVVLRDALIDKSLALRTGDNGAVRREADFLNDPEVSDRRKTNYQTLRDYAAELRGIILRGGL